MTVPPTTRHALVVDDDERARGWMVAAMAKAFPQATIVQAGSVREARSLIQAASPDVALIDLDLPDGSGVTLIEMLSRPPHRTTRIVSTVFADDQHLFPALRAGAVGYLLKDDPIEHLAERIADTVLGRPALSAKVAARLVGWFRAPDSGAADDLTPREREVLTLLAKGLSIRDVAAALSLTPNTAASYTKGLYRKLDVSNRAEATIEAARRGLIRP